MFYTNNSSKMTDKVMPFNQFFHQIPVKDAAVNDMYSDN